ncbi:hypothetical protein ACVME8_006510 [Bradyrhizobium diazoefficiens]
MQLAVTIRRDEHIDQLKPLIETLRGMFASENVQVFEAPTDFNYPYSFPVVTVSEGPEAGRHFGLDAVDVLRSLSKR